MSFFCMTCSALATAQDKETKPVLVLDSGGHTGRIWDAVFTPTGKELITVSYDKTIRIWDVDTGQSVRTLRPPIGPGSQGRLICTALSPDGATVAMGGTGVADAENAIYVVSLISGQMTHVLKGHTAPINAVAFSPDGKLLASAANDETGRIWELASGKCLHVLQGHTHYNVNAITFSRDGDWVGTASSDVRIWSVKTGKETLKLPKMALWVAFATDDSIVATASGEGVCLWDRKGKFLKQTARTSSVYCAFTRDSKQIFFTGGSGITGFYTIDSGKILELTDKRMNGGGLSPDGLRVATVDDAGATYLWNVAEPRLVRSLFGDSKPAFRAGWSPDGKTLAFGTSAQPGRSFQVDTLDLTDGAPAKVHLAQTSQGPLNLHLATVFVKRKDAIQGKETVKQFVWKWLGTGDDSPKCSSFWNTNRAAVGNGNGQVFLFNVETGKLEREFKGHVGEVWDVAPSPDGRYLLSASNDHTLRSLAAGPGQAAAFAVRRRPAMDCLDARRLLRRFSRRRTSDGVASQQRPGQDGDLSSCRPVSQHPIPARRDPASARNRHGRQGP